MNTGFLRDAVATTLTVYGIETIPQAVRLIILLLVATTLTVYGIETLMPLKNIELRHGSVATTLTVYGIETDNNKQSTIFSSGCNNTYRLRY